MKKATIIFSSLALLASIVATIFLLTAPIYQFEKTTITESDSETIQGTATLVNVNGRQVVIQLLVVTLVSGIPLLAALKKNTSQRILTWISALLLAAYAIAGSFTIGLFFMPSAILLLIAAIAT